MNAARRARPIVRNVERILALEYLRAALAIALQLSRHRNRDLRPGKGTQVACEVLRSSVVAMPTWGRALYPHIRTASHLVRSESLVRATRAAVGEVAQC
jgi:histidine ammonia-lyase